MTNIIFGICSVLFLGLLVFSAEIVNTFSNLMDFLIQTGL